MAARELMRNRATRYSVFHIDSADDIQYLPTSKKSGTGELCLSAPCIVGSMARAVDGTKYVLNGSDEWVAYNGGSGGGGGSDEFLPIDSATIQGLFD